MSRETILTLILGGVLLPVVGWGLLLLLEVKQNLAEMKVALIGLDGQNGIRGEVKEIKERVERLEAA